LFPVSPLYLPQSARQYGTQAEADRLLARADAPQLEIFRLLGADIPPSARPSVTGSGHAAEGAIAIGRVRFDDQN
jgi:hypothetical protein